ncbi:MAG: RodZ domain-containing protein [Polaromonas sp.]
MSEQNFGSAERPGASISQSGSGLEPSAGALLRDAREAAGLHLATLAASLKVPVKRLEALEQDRFDLLPDAVFARALASSVCRMLKLDSTGVLERLPGPIAPTSTTQNRGINEPFRSRNIGLGSTLGVQFSRPAVLAGLALLLGALVLIFLPVVQKDFAPSKLQTDASPGKDVLIQQLPEAAVVAGASSEGSAKSAVSPAPVSEPADVAGATAGASTPVSAAPAVTQDVASPAPVPALASNATPAVPVQALPYIIFRAKGESWVQVIDAKGVVVLNRTFGAGEVAEVSGTLPLKAVVGRAEVMDVQVRGQAFDLTPVAKNNVARFEVK